MADVVRRLDHAQAAAPDRFDHRAGAARAVHRVQPPLPVRPGPRARPQGHEPRRREPGRAHVHPFPARASSPTTTARRWAGSACSSSPTASLPSSICSSGGCSIGTSSPSTASTSRATTSPSSPTPASRWRVPRATPTRLRRRAAGRSHARGRACGPVPGVEQHHGHVRRDARRAVPAPRGGATSPCSTRRSACVSPRLEQRWAAEVGSLEPGKCASLIIDVSRSALAPIADPYSALVYGANQDDITLTVVGGRDFYRDRAHLGADAGRDPLHRHRRPREAAGPRPRTRGREIGGAESGWWTTPFIERRPSKCCSIAAGSSSGRRSSSASWRSSWPRSWSSGSSACSTGAYPRRRPGRSTSRSPSTGPRPRRTQGPAAWTSLGRGVYSPRRPCRKGASGAHLRSDQRRRGVPQGRQPARQAEEHGRRAAAGPAHQSRRRLQPARRFAGGGGCVRRHHGAHAQGLRSLWGAARDSTAMRTTAMLAFTRFLELDPKSPYASEVNGSPPTRRRRLPHPLIADQVRKR